MEKGLSRDAFITKLTEQLSPEAIFYVGSGTLIRPEAVYVRDGNRIIDLVTFIPEEEE